MLDCSLERPLILVIYTYASCMHVLQRLGIHGEDLLEDIRFNMFREEGDYLRDKKKL